MKKYILPMILLILFVLFPIPSYANTILSDELIPQILDYRMNTVEKSKTRVFLMQFYNKHKNESKSSYILSSTLEICKRTSYQLGKYNPYDVLRGKSNCQGYSFMFYLMLQKANIPCRVIYNKTHMWNEVKLKDDWMKYDVTAMDATIFKSLR